MKKTTNRSHFVPEGWHTVTPRVVVHDAKQLVEFLKRVFGAIGDYRQAVPSEVRIGDSVVMISDAGMRSPGPPFFMSMSAILTRRISARSTPAHVLSRSHPTCFMGTGAAWWKTMG